MSQVLPDDAIAEIMLMIQGKTTSRSGAGIPPDEQRLTFEDKILEGHRTLADYNIGRHASLRLLVRRHGGMVSP